MLIPLFTTTFFQIDADDINQILGYMADFFENFSLLLWLIVGVGVALLVIRAIISAIRH